MNAVAMRICPESPVRFHAYANLFPMLQGAELDTLREDVRRNGVREPIVMLGDAILDGRNRYMCARDLGMAYPVREFDGDDPLAFVISANLVRRHLSESQRASIAARLETMERGRPAAGKDANWQVLSLSEQARSTPTPISRSAAARMMNVGERSVARAKQVQDDAPTLTPLVDAGTISVSLATKVAELPPRKSRRSLPLLSREQREIAREKVKAHVARNSGNNEWYTPAEFVGAARAVLGDFDLDPASSAIANRTVQAHRFFTAENDGLAQEWPVGRIWMNPPYAQPLIGQFAEKMAQEVQRGSSAIVLVNNATETAWFQTMATEASAICFPKGRIRFVDPEGKPSCAPLQGQAIIYCGALPDDFEDEFSRFGFVVRHG